MSTRATALVLLGCAIALVAAGIAAATPAKHRRGPFAVGELVVALTDTSRAVHFPGQPQEPRPLVTEVRYPLAPGPFPLIVFGHGFNVTPGIYARLLRAWASAGYVVAAPIFPLGNANAPGGANESDIVNQPADMSFVIGQMLAANRRRHGILARLIDPREIAVAGQSDGGITALAAAYNSSYIDHRIDAAIVLAGAELPGTGSYFPPGSPPLLAAQGTADTVNSPHFTYDFFNAARRPKFLLSLLGAPHLGPFTYEQPQLGIVERTTIAFLDRYLKRTPLGRARMWKFGDVAGVATLTNGV